jgi:SAM-dependent methyltransferase
MKYYLGFAPAIFLLSLLAGCGAETATAEPPTLLREKSASTISEPIAFPQDNEGSFESLVADYESKDRVIWQKPDLVIAQLGDLEGKTVADIGAGTGYFTFRLVPRAGKVIGIDIDQRFIDFMESVKLRLDEHYRDRFETRLAKADDPLLKPGEADAVLIVNTYGYIGDRVRYLGKLRQGMSAGAQLVIIDFKKNYMQVGPPEEYKVSSGQVQRELESAGFTITRIDNTSLDYQYIVLASKSAEDK